MAEWKATPEQQAAAQDRGGALLVAAAAGSGKTKVLVDRLMGYLTDPDDPADLDEFLIITYTRAAAAELRGKIAARLGEMLAEDPDNKHLQRQRTRVYLAQISTVHAFQMLSLWAHLRMASRSSMSKKMDFRRPFGRIAQATQPITSPRSRFGLILNLVTSPKSSSISSASRTSHAPTS